MNNLDILQGKLESCKTLFSVQKLYEDTMTILSSYLNSSLLQVIQSDFEGLDTNLNSGNNEKTINSIESLFFEKLVKMYFKIALENQDTKYKHLTGRAGVDIQEFAKMYSGLAVEGFENIKAFAQFVASTVAISISEEGLNLLCEEDVPRHIAKIKEAVEEIGISSAFYLIEREGINTRKGSMYFVFDEESLVVSIANPKITSKKTFALPKMS